MAKNNFASCAANAIATRNFAGGARDGSWPMLSLYASTRASNWGVCCDTTTVRPRVFLVGGSEPRRCLAAGRFVYSLFALNTRVRLPAAIVSSLFSKSAASDRFPAHSRPGGAAPDPAPAPRAVSGTSRHSAGISVPKRFRDRRQEPNRRGSFDTVAETEGGNLTRGPPELREARRAPCCERWGTQS